MKQIHNSNAGFTTLIFLSLLLMLSLLGINAMMTSTAEVNIAGYELNSTYALNAAEAGMEKASEEVLSYYKANKQFPSPPPSGSFAIGNYTVRYKVTKSTTTLPKTLWKGAHSGLYSDADEFTVAAAASSPGVQAKTTLAESVTHAKIPVFQYAVFYDDDLEIAPTDATVIGGRVHTNKDLYVQSNTSVKIDSYTTSGRNVFHGRHPLSGLAASNGSVDIKDEAGTYRNMKNVDNTWLDANDPNWVPRSTGRWGSRVEDKEHGITQLVMAPMVLGQSIDMIKPAGGANPDSYEHLAGLKMTNGQVYWKQASGTWVNVTAYFTANSILVSSTFTDAREGKLVSSSDFDISKLNTCPYWPTNGVMYTTNVGGANLAATRLFNGVSLKAALTVASENPIYIKGDYNSTNKKAASIICDALTILSNNWSDANSAGPLAGRVASDTKVYAGYVTGDVPSGAGGGSSYSGGLENLLRYLENWNGKKFTWIGSAVSFWHSVQATGLYGTGYFNPPTRIWSYETNFLDPTKLPPATPRVSVVLRESWRELVGDAANQVAVN